MSEIGPEEDLKHLLGDMGIEILLAVGDGAKNFEMIKIFSGTPYSCIKGRIPILIEFGLIYKDKEEYLLTKKGERFHKKLKKGSILYP
jgi:predicted transcriptional regulator